MDDMMKEKTELTGGKEDKAAVSEQEALMALTSLILWAYRRMGGKAGNFVMF